MGSDAPPTPQAMLVTSHPSPLRVVVLRRRWWLLWVATLDHLLLAGLAGAKVLLWHYVRANLSAGHELAMACLWLAGWHARHGHCWAVMACQGCWCTLLAHGEHDISIKCLISLSYTVAPPPFSSMGGDAPPTPQTMLVTSHPVTAKGGGAPPPWWLLASLGAGHELYRGMSTAGMPGMGIAGLSWLVKGAGAPYLRSLADAMAWLWCFGRARYGRVMCSCRARGRHVKGAHGCHWRRML
ncbi:hypothetical protein CJ030_MR0G027760 [Morella rubra]|uniref:Uncharacterized protein n=1 Tax=Morella rubra TaxID=262757 RepID=A0A6A1UFJ9_9ROSI|nr:hypothetical protein CJ030_MR0G027778 [Morella rubra]KAB1199084.1 hypothetical protein CJ030_MR0G027760 [Morella rubra]